MLSLNLPQSPWLQSLLYSYASADFVVLTLSDARSEKAVADGIDRRRANGSGPIPYSELLSGSYILLGVDGGLDFDAAKTLEGAVLSNKTTPVVTSLDSFRTPVGLTVARYALGNERNPGYPIETVFVPFTKSSTNTLGEQVQGVSIRTLRDEAFVETPFAEVYNSFAYH